MRCPACDNNTFPGTDIDLGNECSKAGVDNADVLTSDEGIGGAERNTG